MRFRLFHFLCALVEALIFWFLFCVGALLCFSSVVVAGGGGFALCIGLLLVGLFLVWLAFVARYALKEGWDYFKTRFSTEEQFE